MVEQSKRRFHPRKYDGHMIQTCDEKQQKLVNVFYSGATIALTKSGQDYFINNYEPTESDESPLPVVVLVCGVSGNGKSEFVKFAQKYMATEDISIVDVPKAICKQLHDQTIEDYAKIASATGQTTIPASLGDRTDQYRQFIFDIREAWAKFCNGPIQNVTARIIDLINGHVSGKEQYDAIFVQIREREQIIKLRETLVYGMGIPTLIVKLQGRRSAEEFANDSDHNADIDIADIAIDNVGSLDDLAYQAKVFSSLLKAAASMYGERPVFEEPEYTDGTTTVADPKGLGIIDEPKYTKRIVKDDPCGTPYDSMTVSEFMRLQSEKAEMLGIDTTGDCDLVGKLMSSELSAMPSNTSSYETESDHPQSPSDNFDKFVREHFSAATDE